ncbi:Ribonuclease P/MRP protein subunit POP5 like [Verticillium longisporum]|uniref:Ribonuclease P/MRP protein subunit POP5 like n=1 Tax=Verticillium longisporum TaxID=100787 RepID=A0A8I2ZN66_VERLO|nr:Ribonuclease P/MRP protein subunit POP5 like [Verticillium longisporum]
MVRIKERYLLVNILYPLDTTRRTDSNVPAFVSRHRPTPGDLLPRDLVKGILQQVTALFGDYGSGAFEGNNLVVKYFSKATSTFILKFTSSVLWY